MPTEFPTIAPRGHRPRLGTAPRVPFSTCMVDVATHAEISRLLGLSGLSKGILVDRMVAFCVARSFDPLKTKRASTPSTEPPARTNKGKPQAVPQRLSVNRKPTTSRHGQK